MHSLRVGRVLVEVRELVKGARKGVEITLYDLARDYEFIESSRIWPEFDVGGKHG